MPTHDIVVVGASAGGVEALMGLAARLPPGLRAAVFVVLHISPSGGSHLPAILSRAGALPAAHAQDGESITTGRLYIAPPDYHLLVREGCVALWRGPRENASRPAVDPLFRSAARAYGPRVVGVVLSGALGDGAVGMAAVAARGGVTVVQDPDEALFDGMPRAALHYVPNTHSLPVAEIPSLLVRLAHEPVAEKGWPNMSETGEHSPTQSRPEIDEDSPPQITRDIAAQAQNRRGGETTVYTCPECGGTLWQVEREGVTQFNCHVGHVYGPEILLDHMSDELEAALWSCVRMLMERATLRRQLAGRLQAAGRTVEAGRIEEQAVLDDRNGALVRDTLQALGAPSAQTLAVEPAFDEGETLKGTRSERG
jgi:two-component system chemotaxis response regulator CheB